MYNSCSKMPTYTAIINITVYSDIVAIKITFSIDRETIGSLCSEV